MAKIHIKGSRDSYEIPDNAGEKIKEKWLAGTLAGIVEVGAITLKSSEIKLIETYADSLKEKQGKFYLHSELDTLETELEPYRIKNPYPEYKCETYLPTEGIYKYLQDKGIINESKTPYAHKIVEYQEFNEKLSAIGNRKRNRESGEQEKLKQYEEIASQLKDDLEISFA